MSIHKNARMNTTMVKEGSKIAEAFLKKLQEEGKSCPHRVTEACICLHADDLPGALRILTDPSRERDLTKKTCNNYDTFDRDKVRDYCVEDGLLVQVIDCMRKRGDAGIPKKINLDGSPRSRAVERLIERHWFKQARRAIKDNGSVYWGEHDGVKNLDMGKVHEDVMDRVGSALACADMVNMSLACVDMVKMDAKGKSRRLLKEMRKAQKEGYGAGHNFPLMLNMVDRLRKESENSTESLEVIALKTSASLQKRIELSEGSDEVAVNEFRALRYLRKCLEDYKNDDTIMIGLAAQTLAGQDDYHKARSCLEENYEITSKDIIYKQFEVCYAISLREEIEWMEKDGEEWRLLCENIEGKMSELKIPVDEQYNPLRLVLECSDDKNIAQAALRNDPKNVEASTVPVKMREWYKRKEATLGAWCVEQAHELYNCRDRSYTKNYNMPDSHDLHKLMKARDEVIDVLCHQQIMKEQKDIPLEERYLYVINDEDYQEMIGRELIGTATMLRFNKPGSKDFINIINTIKDKNLKKEINEVLDTLKSIDDSRHLKKVAKYMCETAYHDLEDMTRIVGVICSVYTDVKSKIRMNGRGE